MALVANFLLLGLVCIGVLTSGISNGIMNPFSRFLLFLVPVLDIVLMLGSRVNYRTLAFWDKNKTGEEKVPGIKPLPKYLVIKMAAIILNLVLAGIIYRSFVSRYPMAWNYLMVFFALFVILTPILSLVSILISTPNKFRDVKHDLVFAGVSLGALLLCFVLVMRIWIGLGIRDRIHIAKQQYPGIAEDALIAYLSDSKHTPRERSDIAVWTLGQIRSRKALPVLRKLYKNDPGGMTCKGHHNEVLCQYEIHKAIVSIEHDWLGAKEKNWFGSWSRLNK
jgi:hypothetical protein